MLLVSHVGKKSLKMEGILLPVAGGHHCNCLSFSLCANLNTVPHNMKMATRTCQQCKGDALSYRHLLKCQNLQSSGGLLHAQLISFDNPLLTSCTTNVLQDSSLCTPPQVEVGAVKANQKVDFQAMGYSLKQHNLLAIFLDNIHIGNAIVI